jgi:hypothetical protein
MVVLSLKPDTAMLQESYNIHRVVTCIVRGAKLAKRRHAASQINRCFGVLLHHLMSESCQPRSDDFETLLPGFCSPLSRCPSVSDGNKKWIDRISMFELYLQRKSIRS